MGVYRQETELPTDAPQRWQQQRRHSTVSLLQETYLSCILLLLLGIPLIPTTQEAGARRSSRQTVAAPPAAAATICSARSAYAAAVSVAAVEAKTAAGLRRKPLDLRQAGVKSVNGRAASGATSQAAVSASVLMEALVRNWKISSFWSFNSTCCCCGCCGCCCCCRSSTKRRTDDSRQVGAPKGGCLTEEKHVLDLPAVYSHLCFLGYCSVLPVHGAISVDSTQHFSCKQPS